MNTNKNLPPGLSAPTPLADQQLQFSRHIRDPQHAAAPAGIEDRRMAIYRDLFFNNLRSMLGGNFPVLRQIMGPQRWSNMIRDFMRQHRAHTPMFPELPREFLQYLQDERQPDQDDPPFMLELAHYEWVELALALDDATIDDPRVDEDGDLLEQIPVLSPLAWQVSYHFPVQHIRPDFQPDEAPPQPTHLLVYRRSDDSVHFMQLQPLSARLYHLLKDNDSNNGRSLLSAIAKELGHTDSSALIQAGLKELQQWRDREIILGTRQQQE
ncbi:MAG: DUF2063 domain-containing protein [Wenzhouxiangellaceae bacterium]